MDNLIARLDQLVSDMADVREKLETLQWTRVQKVVVFVLGLAPGFLLGLFFGFLFMHWTPR